MRFNLISNINNGVGLQRDYRLLRQALESRGHQVQGVQFNAKPLLVHPADVNIFIEVVAPTAIQAAPVQWVIPHPEWWFSGWEQYHFHKVLAKTRDCERIFRAKVGDRCQYLGWMSKDVYYAGVKRERRFLHVCGKSKFKNTLAVIQGCQQARVPLTVIGEYPNLVNQRVEEPELMRLMNSHFCHVMPSMYEGYGHVLHEAQSAGQVLITTNAPPMNTVSPAFCIPSLSTTAHHAGTLHTVSPLEVCKAVRRAAALSDAEVDGLRAAVRASYERDVLEFQAALDELVGTA